MTGKMSSCRRHSIYYLVNKSFETFKSKGQGKRWLDHQTCSRDHLAGDRVLVKFLLINTICAGPKTRELDISQTLQG